MRDPFCKILNAGLYILFVRFTYRPALDFHRRFLKGEDTKAASSQRKQKREAFFGYLASYPKRENAIFIKEKSARGFAFPVADWGIPLIEMYVFLCRHKVRLHSTDDLLAVP